ncbi:CaiB/BaiF CoA transferase family protein [Cupriavidus metallidurans]|uniref:Alpha-methylacyl-CoA racemase n=1 Tax=Cupriavidus metallidurans (strain ATCC 43123 / DSM 2839 / NBRC 102507 / CH34) TaxID=266264 RepID=Q1LBR1_CUPMC|nr:CaiB/BaiF CoA-transferase family protein [Cupriavidus metallidurans]ABF12415.1 Alpha-methylacyl-CoA racemase [Cupriavidus metallidurans CH34]
MLKPEHGRGPLNGVRVVEFAGLGPAPFACMMLADMGADVVRIDRPGTKARDNDLVGRGRRTVLLDLKAEGDIERARSLLAQADILVEGFRPGVMERLGLGPDTLLNINPRLVYGRMTGWGQDGPLSLAAGHDINYIALTGALAAIGDGDGLPVPPLNLVGDYGGGSLYLLVGILAALHNSRETGHGQVIDAAICDGAMSLMTFAQSQRLNGLFKEQRSSNMLDGGAPYYTTYRTKDDKVVCVGAIEPQFFALLCEKLGVKPELRDAQNDRKRWPILRAELEQIFKGQTQAEWTALLEGTDSCFSPVISLGEVSSHPHMAARGALTEVDGVACPAPAPRFSRTPTVISDLDRLLTTAEDISRQWESTNNR